MSIQQFMMASGAAWVPTQISTLVAWFDASDSSTITLTSSSVDRWYDKVLTTRYGEQTVSADKPTYSATARNSRPGIIFDGATERLPLNNITNFPTGTTNSSAFVVAHNNEVGTWRGLMGWGDLSATGGNRSIGITGASSNHGWDSWTGFSEIGVTWPADTDKLVYQTWILSSSPDISQWAINGGTLTDGTGAGDNSTDTARGVIGDIAGATATNLWNGTIQEIFIFSNVISETDRKKLDGYAAHKWGLASVLPSDHPYKASPPLG